MKKDIEIPIAKQVYVAVVLEWDKEFLSKEWSAYLVNERFTAIDMALVVSKGYDKERKTTTMRHNVGLVESKSFQKFELMMDAIFALNNEFFITFFADNKMYERKIVFEKDSINEKNVVTIPLLEKEGILGK
ncbi:MAG: hypothetical protein V3U92_07410 [Cellulophaga sp.]